MRLAVSSLVLLSLLACAGLTPGEVATAPITPVPQGAAVAPAVPTSVTIPVFAPAIGDRFAVSTDMGLILDLSAGAETGRVEIEEGYTGELMVRSLTNGRVEGVTVRVTTGKSVMVSPDGRKESLPDSVGKEYIVTRAENGEHRVERAGGGVVGDGETGAPRRLADTVFDDRTGAITVSPGGTADVEELLGAAQAGETLSGMLTLGPATPDCSAPFSGVYAGTDTTGGMTVAKSMTGDLCMDRDLGLRTQSSFQGSATLAGSEGSGSGTARISRSLKKL